MNIESATSIINHVNNQVNHVQPWPTEWSEDWFVVGATGAVHGPLPASEVFDNAETVDARYVSRRGFAQWYDVKDFAGLWQSSRQMTELLDSMSQPKVPQPKVGHLEMAQAKGRGDKGRGDDDDQYYDASDDEIIRALSLTGVDPAALTAPVSTPLQPSTEPAEPSLEIKNHIAEDPKIRWLSRRASQRLGKLVNPVIPAILTLATFGLGHVAWLLGSLREVVWHLDHDTNVDRYVKHQWMAWIPGLHLKTTWDLACLIRSMEEQDGYTSTSPHVAVMLGVCPPLSALYLQHAMNDHWLIHCVV